MVRVQLFTSIYPISRSTPLIMRNKFALKLAYLLMFVVIGQRLTDICFVSSLTFIRVLLTLVIVVLQNDMQCYTFNDVHFD